MSWAARRRWPWPLAAAQWWRSTELSSHGIRVNAVAPQLLHTPANRAMFPVAVMAKAVAAEAIASVIAFLVSDAAAPVSGAILPV